MQICNKRFYLLSQMKKQGLPQKQLQHIFEAIIVSRILYAAPAWRRYTHIADIEVFRRCLIRLNIDKLLCRIIILLNC